VIYCARREKKTLRDTTSSAVKFLSLDSFHTYRCATISFFLGDCGDYTSRFITLVMIYRSPATSPLAVLIGHEYNTDGVDSAYGRALRLFFFFMLFFIGWAHAQPITGRGEYANLTYNFPAVKMASLLNWIKVGHLSTQTLRSTWTDVRRTRKVLILKSLYWIVEATFLPGISLDATLF